jgi:hypothetical protein
VERGQEEVAISPKGAGIGETRPQVRRTPTCDLSSLEARWTGKKEGAERGAEGLFKGAESWRRG